jgi:hypothetical protein
LLTDVNLSTPFRGRFHRSLARQSASTVTAQYAVTVKDVGNAFYCPINTTLQVSAVMKAFAGSVSTVALLVGL